MDERIKMFCEEKIGIDVTGMTMTDPMTIELINVLKKHTKLHQYYPQSIEDYFKELVDQHWEILVNDGNELNAYRGTTAEHYRTDNPTYSIEEFLGKQMDIEENTLMEMFN